MCLDLDHYKYECVNHFSKPHSPNFLIYSFVLEIIFFLNRNLFSYWNNQGICKCDNKSWRQITIVCYFWWQPIKFFGLFLCEDWYLRFVYISPNDCITKSANECNIDASQYQSSKYENSILHLGPHFDLFLNFLNIEFGINTNLCGLSECNRFNLFIDWEFPGIK